MTILWAPFTFVLYSGMVAMLMIVWVTGRWLYIAVPLHLIAAVMTTMDEHLLAILWHHLWFRRYYGAS